MVDSSGPALRIGLQGMLTPAGRKVTSRSFATASPGVQLSGPFFTSLVKSIFLPSFAQSQPKCHLPIMTFVVARFTHQEPQSWAIRGNEVGASVVEHAPR